MNYIHLDIYTASESWCLMLHDLMHKTHDLGRSNINNTQQSFIYSFNNISNSTIIIFGCGIMYISYIEMIVIGLDRLSCFERLHVKKLT